MDPGHAPELLSVQLRDVDGFPVWRRADPGDGELADGFGRYGSDKYDSIVRASKDCQYGSMFDAQNSESHRVFYDGGTLEAMLSEARDVWGVWDHRNVRPISACVLCEYESFRTHFRSPSSFDRFAKALMKREGCVRSSA